VSGRLWRTTRPDISEDEREALTKALMSARRGIAAARRSGDLEQEHAWRRKVHDAKVGLGERGALWWSDGAPDYNRRMAANTPYAAWFSQLIEAENK
jgi:hypothetical protein